MRSGTPRPWPVCPSAPWSVLSPVGFPAVLSRLVGERQLQRDFKAAGNRQIIARHSAPLSRRGDVRTSSGDAGGPAPGSLDQVSVGPGVWPRCLLDRESGPVTSEKGICIGKRNSECKERRTPHAARQTPNAKRQTPNATRQTPEPAGRDEEQT
ncbi:hypothetical protein EYF80_056481 [Liparis tanakae]|uniref:Uncharacterized protein n=1 Tax=Liparis tanakae TaxID=230148 RepID=A0A4Z2EYD6_9TELE|nr:hypothetical protein EYF80_056481 [Liparis tanakae]